ncbi:hypothetical protein B296_00018530 [Ensete ventricosum]|uniref:Uncharacterized protein n=1 Tax=Ensete ventricosum TaxID=4639 RepID=A0A426Z650_ENSVE|nr:hypothetical protein B296_00018530 [Ensete ventricosum]
MVAYLHQIWWLEVRGEVEFCFPEGIYSLFFRLHLGRAIRRLGRRVCSPEHIHGWDKKPVRFQLSTSDGQLAQSKCYLGEPGSWLHYHVGDFAIRSSSASIKIKFSMIQIDCTHTKGGLCVDSPHTYPIGGPTYVVHRLRRVGFRRHNRWWVGSPDGCVEWKQDVSEPQSPPSAKLVDLELLLTPLVSDPDAYPLKPATTGLRERKLRGANSETTHVGPAQLNRIRLISDRSRRCSWFAEPLRILYVNRVFALMSPKPSKLHLRVWAAWLWTSCTWHLRNTDAPD